jgi:amino acid permease
MVQQQTVKASSGGLPPQYSPPKQPWAYLQGFLLAVPVTTGLMLSLTSPGGSEANTAMADLVSSVGFLGVWVGYGIWRTKSYAKQLEEWKNTIASKLLCLRCGHAFEV